MISPADLEVRPARGADRDLVDDLGADAEAWQDRFDDWIVDPAGQLWAGEVGARLAGLVRLRSIARRVVHVDGLVVDVAQRGQGIGSALLLRMVEVAGRQGAAQLRAEATGEAARRVAARAGFQRAAQARRWHAARQEGGEPSRLAAPADVPRLLQAAAAGPEGALMAGRLLAPGEGRDLDRETLEERAGQGAIRVAGGGRAFAVLLDEDSALVVAALLGVPALWPQLAEELRFEADLHDLAGVEAWLPPGHAAETALEAVGYHRDDAASLDALQRATDA